MVPLEILCHPCLLSQKICFPLSRHACADLMVLSYCSFLPEPVVIYFHQRSLDPLITRPQRMAMAFRALIYTAVIDYRLHIFPH